MNNQWHTVLHQSGTSVVMKIDHQDGDPWIDVRGPQTEEDRVAVCRSLQEYLNGGEKPKWIDDLTRTAEDQAQDLDGTWITCIGPMYDSDPPKLNWVEDESNEAQDKRARLMDLIMR